MAAGDGSYLFDEPFDLVDAYDACSAYLGEPRRRQRGALVSPSLAEDLEHLRAARGVFEDRRCGDPDGITSAIDALEGERCDACGADLGDGEGYDGRCGDCADRAEAASQPSDECGVHRTFQPRRVGDEAFEAICTKPAGHEGSHQTPDGWVW